MKTLLTGVGRSNCTKAQKARISVRQTSGVPILHRRFSSNYQKGGLSEAQQIHRRSNRTPLQAMLMAAVTVDIVGQLGLTVVIGKWSPPPSAGNTMRGVDFYPGKDFIRALIRGALQFKAHSRLCAVPGFPH